MSRSHKLPVRITQWTSIALLAGSVLAIASIGHSFYRTAEAGAEMTTAGKAFLASLDKEQLATAQLSYDSPKRLDWHFIPKAARKGVQIKDMNDSQRKAAHALLKSAVSQVGYDKATAVMSLEAILKELEKSKTGGNIRDTERYYFTLFGEPTAEGKWGLSVEGHHLSLNFVVEKGRIVSSTPNFYGANPAEVKGDYVPGIKTGLRVLKQEEVLAFELVKSLNDEQKKVAVLAPKAPADIRGPAAQQPPQEAPVGITYDKLNAEQQKLLVKLLEAYTGNVTADVAGERWTKIKAAGLEKIHFAWAGATEPGVGHYYRIQGPTFLVEFNNTQPDAAGNLANHIHCVWRDMAGDFALPAGK